MCSKQTEGMLGYRTSRDGQPVHLVDAMGGGEPLAADRRRCGGGSGEKQTPSEDWGRELDVA